ncbi:Copia protein [Golovinomyces cichoracearum]|uniref:Copia protein n=1 Tax=Golovinomyces cichoracearum TaxID=62708 RepID=A0A420JC65_9PEZI|nr:Copia protein [Golovinomyces cichoracearum]
MINVYSDTDFATDPADRKSITGMVLMINGGVTTFGNSKQPGVSRSTSEAEYIGMSDSAKRGLNDEKDSNPVPILHEDNSAAVTLTKGLKIISAIRHIATSYDHILHKLHMGMVVTKWDPNNKMLADGFTKPLTRIIFVQKRNEIGDSRITEVMKKILGDESEDCVSE